jgi:hypothetical protein
MSAMPTRFRSKAPKSSLDYDKSLLTLRFTLPLATPLNAHSQEVQVDVYDPSFFVAFGFATEAPVTLTGPVVKGCTAEVKKPDPDTEEDAKALSESFFSQLGPNSNFGSQFAQTVTVKCSDAPHNAPGFRRVLFSVPSCSWLSRLAGAEIRPINPSTAEGEHRRHLAPSTSQPRGRLAASSVGCVH